MKVVILCGGRGVRAYPFTEHLPKPMLPVNGSPILVHIIKSFIAQGFREFVLAAGYKKNVLDDYFDSKDLGAAIQIVDTGSDRDTGGRILACKDHLGDSFIATYGDGLSDIPLQRLVEFHRGHGKLATVTVAPLVTQYGVLEADTSGRVTAMREKPVMHGHWINIGFMVFQKEIFQHWAGENLERDVLPALAADGQLFMFRHDGFFKSMDSYKEQQELEDLVGSGRASLAGLSMSFWKGRKVFVTGCTGFLGLWLTRELVARGASVVGLIRDIAPSSPFFADGTAADVIAVHGALDDLPLLERVIGEYEIETVFHLAAQAIVGVANLNPLGTFETNIRGTWNLLEAGRRSARPLRVVVASSDKAYGIHEALPYTEEHALRGTHPYDVSKSCADLISLAYHHTYATKVCVTRCGNLFGGGDLNFNRLIPGTIRSALRGERPIIRSDGSMVRDYVYVRDIAAAYLLLAERMEDPGVVGKAFNFATGEPLSVLEVTRLILKAAARQDLEPVILNEAKAEIPRQYLSAELARERLGWQPSRGVSEGLGETIAWYREYLARIGG